MARIRFAAAPVTRIPAFAARLSLATGVTGMVVLLVLHALKPDLAPSWRMVSEYANGDFGWVGTLLFLLLSLSAASLFAAVRTQVPTVPGRIGLGLLLVAAAALLMAAVFRMDPLTVTPDQRTAQGNLHGLAAMIGNPAFALAAPLVAAGLARNAGWTAARRRLLAAGHVVWVSLVLMFGLLALGAPVGWANRLVVVAYGAWLITTATEAVRLRSRPAQERTAPEDASRSA